MTDRGGDGPPVILLHGLAGSSRELLPTADALTDRFHVLLIDQRGHGRSLRRPADLSREAFVGDVVSVIERLLPGESVRIVGQSPGGLRPRFDADIMQAAIAAVHEPRWTEWKNLTTPTMTVFAEHGMFTAEQRNELIRCRPATRRADLPAGSHDAHLDAFDPWIEILRSYLLEDLSAPSALE